MANFKNSFSDRDSGWKELANVFQLDKQMTAHVGFLRSSGMHKKAEDKAVEQGKTDKKGLTKKAKLKRLGGVEADITVAQIAAIHEFGSEAHGIPERSFMRSSIDENKVKIKKVIDKVIHKMLDSHMSKKQALAIVAQFVADRMKAKIRSGHFKKNSAATIARKRSSKPLIDTGQLLNSVDFEIRDAKGSETE